MPRKQIPKHQAKLFLRLPQEKQLELIRTKWCRIADLTASNLLAQEIAGKRGSVGDYTCAGIAYDKAKQGTDTEGLVISIPAKMLDSLKLAIATRPLPTAAPRPQAIDIASPLATS